MRTWRNWKLFDDAAGVTVEFVAIFPSFLLVTFFAFEMIVSMYYVGTMEKAVQLGARYAVTSNFAITSLSSTQTITPASSSIHPGALCIIAGNCTTPAFATAVCTGGSGSTCSCTGGGGGTCSATDFNAIVNRMKSCSTCTGISALITNANVTITYADSGLGFASGNIVPSVTVTVSGVPYGTIIGDILTNFMKFTNSLKGKGAGTDPLPTNLPTISVTMTGEDMSSSGAS